MKLIREPFAFSLFIPGIPASKGSYRPITGRSRTTGKPVTRLIPMDRKERPWRDHVRDTILSHKHPTIPPNSYIKIETTFYLPRPKTTPPHKRKHPTVKPDIDKLQRALYDAITETHIWHDDCQITDVISHKRYADDTPTGVFLTITWEPNQ
jgi:Holliday junction resolvase RusA-like endonuclease